jgi:hypothetical protein
METNEKLIEKIVEKKLKDWTKTINKTIRVELQNAMNQNIQKNVSAPTGPILKQQNRLWKDVVQPQNGNYQIHPPQQQGKTWYSRSREVRYQDPQKQRYFSPQSRHQYHKYRPIFNLNQRTNYVQPSEKDADGFTFVNRKNAKKKWNKHAPDKGQENRGAQLRQHR